MYNINVNRIKLKHKIHFLYEISIFPVKNLISVANNELDIFFRPQ